MSSKFGKDFREVSEATITGLRYGAGSDFWATLAHSDFIGRTRQLAEHYGVCTSPTSLVVDLRAELAEWLKSLDGTCLMCFTQFEGCVPLPEGRLMGEDTLVERRAAFAKALISRITAMNISVRELQVYLGGYMDLTKRSVFVQCLNRATFMEALDKIFTARRVMLMLPPAEEVAS